MRKGLRAVLIVTALALGVLAVVQLHSLYQRHLRLIHVGDHRLDPLAPVDAEKRYGIVVWEQPLPWHGGLPHDRRLALEMAAAEFSEKHPNVHIEIAFHEEDDFVATVQQATIAGMGPDIVGLSSPGLLIAPQFQVPITPYMSAAADEDIIPAIRRALVYEEAVWAWPRWTLPVAWLAWYDAFAQGAPSPMMTADDLMQGVSSFRHVAGGQPPIAYNAFDPSLFTSVAVAAGGMSLLSDEGTVQWSESLLVDLGTMWRNLVQRGALHPDPRQAATSRLSRFDGRRAAIVAAPSWPVVQLMLSRYGDIRHGTAAWAGEQGPALRFMAAPYIGNRLQGTWGRVAGYAVLLQDPRTGDDHITVAMRVAEYLSHRVGSWEAATHMALPAYTSALPQWEIDSGLAPDHVRAWYDISQYLVSAPVPYEWAVLETAILEELIVPAFVSLVEGDISPEQFGRQLTQDIPAYMAAYVPKNDSTLQIP